MSRCYKADDLGPSAKSEDSTDAPSFTWYANPWIYGPAAGILVLGIAGGAYMALREPEQDI